MQYFSEKKAGGKMQCSTAPLKFKILNELGSGAFGSVYLVKIEKEGTPHQNDENKPPKQNSNENSKNNDQPIQYCAYKNINLLQGLRFTVTKTNNEMMCSIRKSFTSASREIELLSRCNHENVIKLDFHEIPDWETVKSHATGILTEARGRSRIVERQTRLRCRRMKQTADQVNKFVNKRLKSFFEDKVMIDKVCGKIKARIFTSFTQNSFSLDKFSEQRVKRSIDLSIDSSKTDFTKKLFTKTMLENTILKITSKLLAGLSYLHNIAGIVHRDIKPANIVITLKPLVVKIIDFGLARDLREMGEGKHKIKSAGGSTCYQAPECTGWKKRQHWSNLTINSSVGVT